MSESELEGLWAINFKSESRGIEEVTEEVSSFTQEDREPEPLPSRSRNRSAR